uniref:Uncharacterized protein n=1 Tax=Anguilla anguilla TaxID=7936 RepID=A0A0E9WJL4_ANGAN
MSRRNAGAISLTKWITLLQSALCQCPVVPLSTIPKGTERLNQKLRLPRETERRLKRLW